MKIRSTHILLSLTEIRPQLQKWAFLAVFLFLHGFANAQDCNIPPTLSVNADALCDTPFVDLNTYVTNSPSGDGTLIWSTSPLQGVGILPSSIVSITDTYYAWYTGLSGGLECYNPSPIATPETTLSITFTTTPTVTSTTPAERCGPGPVTLSATASAGTLNWYTAATAGTLVGTGNSITPDVTVTTTFYVDATVNSCTSSPRVAVTATVLSVPAISGTTEGERCGTGTVLLGATSNSPTATLNWYAAATGGVVLGTGTSFTTPSISTTTTYYVAASENGCTSARTGVVATVNPLPTITGTTPGAICGPGTVQLSATASSPTATINWYATATGGASLGSGGSFTTPVIASTTTYYVDATENGCTTATRTAVVATVNPNPDPGTPADGAACSDEDFGETKIDLDDLFTGPVDDGDWEFTSGPETIDPSGSGEVDFKDALPGNYVFTYTTDTAEPPCVDQSSSTTITVTDCDPCLAGDSAPVLNNGVPTIFCDVVTQSLDDYTSSTPPGGSVLTWSTNPDPLVLSGHLSEDQVKNPIAGTYYGFFYDATNNCASPTLELTLALNTTPIITGTSGEIICGPGPASFSATGEIPNSPEAPSFRWYASGTSTEVLSNFATYTPNISVTTTLWVEATANGCTSEREGVTATVNPQPSAGIPQNTSACSVAANGPTIVDLDDTLIGEDAGNWTVTSDPSGNLSIGVGNIVNFENRPDGEYIFTFTTTGALEPCVNETAEVSILVNDCDVDTDGDGLLDGEEAALGTNPNDRDTDGDGLEDGLEVGNDVSNPLDEDSDGIIDALDSNILDADEDGVVDQKDPANNNPCIPDNTNALCDTDGDGISDGDEIANGSDPLDPCDPNLTPDCEPKPIDLEITKEVDNENASVGMQVTFTITANNLSDSRVLAVEIGDLLETGFEYVAHEASLGAYDPVSGSWAISEIKALESATLDITVSVLEGGTYSNTAQLLESFPMDNNDANNSATVTLIIDLPEGVDLLLEKSALSTRPLVNDNVVFTIRVTNESQEDDVSQIQILDLLSEDAGFVYLSHLADSGEYDPVSGIWEIDVLQLNEQASLQITVRVPREGSFTNTATIVRSSPADGNPSNNEASADVLVSSPSSNEPGFFFNQFSPNGDGTNDVLSINNLELYPNNTMKIYDRYGNKVFEAQGMTAGNTWDGRRQNENSPEGTYYYILDLGDGSEIRKGWIQLIR